MNASVSKFLSRPLHKCVRECTFYWTAYRPEDKESVLDMLKYNGFGHVTKTWRPHSADYLPVLQFEVCKCGVRDMYMMCYALDTTFTLDTRSAEYLWHDMLDLGQRHMQESYEVDGDFLFALYTAG